MAGQQDIEPMQRERVQDQLLEAGDRGRYHDRRPVSRTPKTMPSACQRSIDGESINCEPQRAAQGHRTFDGLPHARRRAMMPRTIQSA